jgi:hypothetical protein
LNRPRSCEYLARPALPDPDRFSLLGATFEPYFVLVAHKPVLVARPDGRISAEQFEYRAISVKMAHAAFDLSSFALDAFRLALDEDE